MQGFKLRAIGNDHRYEHPSLSAPYRIHAFAESFSTKTAMGYSPKGIMHHLSVCQKAAEGIIRSVATGRPIDAGNKIIDKVTQRDELLFISNSLDKIQKIVSEHLEKKAVSAYWSNPFSLYDSNAQLGVAVGQMRGWAIVLDERISAEKATIVANLIERAGMIAPDCLGVVADYLIS